MAQLGIILPNDLLFLIILFRNVLYNDFRTWLHEMTGFTDLTDQVDMSCAKYEHTGKNIMRSNEDLYLDVILGLI